MSRLSKIAITTISLILALIHVAFPELAIDATTLVLIFIAVVPWILPFVQSIDIPGVGKITLKDAKAATSKLVQFVTPATAKVGVTGSRTEVRALIGEEEIGNLWAIFNTDPNLALVGFRIEIERRVRRIARQAGLRVENVPLRQLIRELIERGIVPSEVASGILEIVALGNQAAHGATVDEGAARWVLDVGPSVLLKLEESVR